MVGKLHDAIVKGLATPETSERLASQGAEQVGNTPEQFAVFIREEIDKWGKVVKAAGAKID